jgi:hypothetical protein
MDEQNTINEIGDIPSLLSSTPDSNSPPPISTYSIEDVYEWGSVFVETARISKDKHRRARTAIQELTSVMGADEAKDVESLLLVLDDLPLRWVRKGNKNATTGDTYRGRARTFLEEFVEFKLHGTMPKPGGVVTKEGNGQKAKKKAKKAAAVPVPETQVSLPSSLRQFPPTEHKIQFSLHEDGIKMEDVKKIYFHLLTLTTDFDPSQLFAGTPAPPTAAT